MQSTYRRSRDLQQIRNAAPLVLEILAHSQQWGKIKHLSLTNFDTQHLLGIIGHGITIVSNQVQYSLIDCCPEERMVALCKERQVWLLPYGTLVRRFFI
jgi:aryl-alcohol dehydrogenase-like predicted oxidoreductase